MQNVVIYARGDNKEETKEQLQSLREFAKEQDYKILTEFSDPNKKRINKQIMFEFLNLQKNVDAILVKSIDRLTRDIQEYINYEKIGIKIITINETKPLSFNDFVDEFRDCFENIQKQDRSERIKEGIRQAKSAKGLCKKQ